MSIVRDVPKETRKFVAKTIVSLLISILVLISLYFDFNYFDVKVGQVLGYVFIPLGWFIIYPFALYWFFSIIDKNMPKLIMYWVKFVKEILPLELTFILAFISGLVLAFLTIDMIYSLKNTFDPKMIISYISLFIFAILVCFIIANNHYRKLEKNPPKVIQIYRQTISNHAFTFGIIYFVTTAISWDFITKLLAKVALIIFR